MSLTPQPQATAPTKRLPRRRTHARSITCTSRTTLCYPPSGVKDTAPRASGGRLMTACSAIASVQPKHGFDQTFHGENFGLGRYFDAQAPRGSGGDGAD